MRKRELRRAVKLGAKLLDEQLPGWADFVHDQSLRMESVCNCVLGQLFHSYQFGIRATATCGGDACFEHGFDAEADKDYPVLRQIWLEEIRGRRSR